VHITVVSPAVSSLTVLRWIPPEKPAETGVPVRIALEGFFSGTAGAVSCDAPENALLEKVPLGADPHPGSAPGWVVLAEYRWTPLVSGLQPLPVARVELSAQGKPGNTLVSQDLSVTVFQSASAKQENTEPRAPGKAFAVSSGDQGSSQNPKKNRGADPSASAPPALPAGLAGIPWRKGNYARILRSLRNAEYIHLFPGRFRAYRQTAEAALGLEKTFPVPPAAWKPVGVIGCVIFLFSGLFLKLSGAGRPVLRTPGNAAITLSLFLALFAVFVYTRDLKPAGVVTGGQLLHVPESNSTVVENLPEGSTVQVLRRGGSWLYILSDTGRTGWLEATQVLEYTTTEKLK
jgi:hypothetical protein